MEGREEEGIAGEGKGRGGKKRLTHPLSQIPGYATGTERRWIDVCRRRQEENWRTSGHDVDASADSVVGSFNAAFRLRNHGIQQPDDIRHSWQGRWDVSVTNQLCSVAS